MPLPQYRPESPPPTQIQNCIAVAAGKGGVGKSTVAVHLALALRSLGYQVGLMDTDLYGPSIRQMLPETRPPEQKGDYILPALCSGIKMISMAYFKSVNEATIVRAPIANNLIGQFLKNVIWGNLDYLIIDFPPGTGDIQLTLSQQANITGAVMVTTPQEVALLDVRKAMQLFEMVRIPIVGVVENMSYYQPPGIAEPLFPFGKGGGERLAQQAQIPFLGKIPLDPDLSLLADQGKSLFDIDPSKEKSATQAFMRLAHQVVERNESSFLSITKLQLADQGRMSLLWNDGLEQTIALCELQKRCSCANCRDENTGVSLLDPASVKDDVSATIIEQVGRYGIRLKFTSGCSHGIYEFDLLRQLK